MKQLIVVLFCFLLTFAYSDWQLKDKVDLPRNIHLKDITMDGAGDFWLLTSSSILKLDAQTNNPILITETRDGRMIAVHDNIVYQVDMQNRISRFDPSQDYGSSDLGITLSAGRDLTVITADGEPLIAALESPRVRFADDNKISYYISADADRLAMIPGADYGASPSVFYTLARNQVTIWTGESYRKPESFQGRVIYSASRNIIDIAARPDGGLFVLLADSVVVLDQEGSYRTRIGIEEVPPGAMIFSTPVANRLVLYDPMKKVLLYYAETRSAAEEIVSLDRNHPNPVDNYTEIEFKLNQALDANITIYNLIGEPVKIVARGYYSRGPHRVVWHADDEQGKLVPNGVYFYRLETKKGVAIRQLTVLR